MLGGFLVCVVVRSCLRRVERRGGEVCCGTVAFGDAFGWYTYVTPFDFETYYVEAKNELRFS